MEYTGTQAGSTAQLPPLVVTLEDIRLDILTRRLRIGPVSCALSPKELALLYALMQRLNHVVRKETLYRAVGLEKGDRSVDSLLYRLRKKLAGSGYRIVAVRSQGHRLERHPPKG